GSRRVNVKNLLLFFLVCTLNGILIFVGSVLGSTVGKPYLFAGAIAGGSFGIAVSAKVASRTGLLEGASYYTVLLWSVIGFGIAAVVAVNNLNGPLIPLASVTLVGLGALLGKFLSRRV